MRTLFVLVPLLLAGCGEPADNVPPPQPAPCPAPHQPDNPRCPHCPRCGHRHFPGDPCQPTGHLYQSGCVLSDPRRPISGDPAANWQERRLIGKATIGGPVSPDGKETVTCDLPQACRKRNRGGTDGAGLCVSSSISHSAHWQNVEPVKRYQDFAARFPGGAYPGKVDAQLRQLAPEVKHMHYLGGDLTAIKLALQTGRLPSCTYGGNHMVNAPHCSERWACVLDNNYVGPDELRWFTPADFQRLYSMGGGWTHILLDPRPPAPPHNRKR